MRTLHRPILYPLSVSALAFVLLCLATRATAGGFLDNIKRETGNCLSGGCDVIWQVNRRIDDGISSKVESMTTPAKKAFEEAMRDLFQNDLDPFLDHLSKITNDTLDKIGNMFDKAVATAEDATDRTILLIRTEIIRETAKQIEDVSHSILGDVKCGEINTKEKAQEFIDGNFRLFGSIRDSVAGLFDKCGKVSHDNYWTIYSGLQCEYDIKVSRATTVGEIENDYREFLEETSKAECVLLNSANAEKAKEIEVSITKRVQLWSLAQK